MSETYSSPQITVMMPVYNTAPEFLQEAIKSVLSQTFTDFEFLILLSASPNGCEKMIREYSAKDNRIAVYEFAEDVLPAKKLNYGLRIARGKYIAYFDSDDICHPQRLQRQYAYMEEHSDAAALVSSSIQFNDQGEIVLSVPRCNDNEVLKVRMLFYGGAGITSPTCFFRRSFIVEREISYEDKVAVAFDADICSKIVYAGGRITALPESLLRYRVHNQHSDGNIDRRIASQVVLRRLLQPLLGDLSDEEMRIHINVSVGILPVDIMAFDRHIKRLVEANERLGLYDKKIFEREVYSIWCTTILRTEIKNHMRGYLKSRYKWKIMLPSISGKILYYQVISKLQCRLANKAMSRSK